jgi:hypothetical protein
MSTPEAGSPGKQRRGSVYALMAIASLLAFLAVFAVWAERQLLEEDTWVETSEELLEDEEIRTVVADFMVDELFTAVNVEAQLQVALPPRAQPAAGVLAGGAREVADNLANEALQRPRVQELWAEANRTAHRKLIEVVEHEGDEDVTLDLGTIVGQLGDQLGVDASSKIPPDAAQIEVLRADQLSAAQDIIKLLKGLAIVLTLLAIALWALAIYLARGRRREVLRSIGVIFIVIGVAVLFLRGLAGNLLTESLASTAAIEPAVANTWEISTSLLAAQGGALIFYGIAIVLGAWVAGPGRLGRGVRRAIAPVLERRLIAYTALALLLLLLFWWAPTPGLQRLPTSLLLILLMVIGLEFLRRQAVKDFPGETWAGASERWSSSVQRRLGREQDPGPP